MAPRIAFEGSRRARQLALPLPEPPEPSRRGGARRGAGRKPLARNAKRPLTRHVTRPALSARHPVHVTLRAHGGLPSFRLEAIRHVLERCLARTAARDVHVVHYSLQRDHVHLLVEAGDREALSRGMRRLVIALALRLNRAIGRGRRGKVWGDRWHRHDLKTPREVRNALVYLFGNARHHGVARARHALDTFSSASHFGGWVAPSESFPPDVAAALVRAGPGARDVQAQDGAPVEPAGARSWSSPPPRTWLLRAGYMRSSGPLRLDEVVASRARSPR